MNLARMLAESLALQLASCPTTLCDDAEREGMNPRLVEGLRAARNVFAEHVRETDAEELFNEVKAEVREGLSELEKKR